MKKLGKKQMGGATKTNDDSKKRKGATYTETKDYVRVSRPGRGSNASDGTYIPPKSYSKTIEGNDKTGGVLTVTKSGKTNTFNIPKGKVSSQREIAKKETGYMKTGGMVNPNASVQASKVAKGRPAKSAEPKSAAKKATGKVGGISKAPKTAVPKAKYGMVMRKK